jgi:nucleotide-binding universal stress UspA family protein
MRLARVLPVQLSPFARPNVVERFRASIARMASLPCDILVTTHPSASGLAQKIVEYADENEMDLIVMGTHGRRGLAHALLRSVAERVVRTAHCPALTTRSQAANVEVTVQSTVLAPA